MNDVDGAIYVAASERADAEPEWDSRERREETARDLSAEIEDERAVEARMRADVAQAHPGRRRCPRTAGPWHQGPARPGCRTATAATRA